MLRSLILMATLLIRLYLNINIVGLMVSNAHHQPNIKTLKMRKQLFSLLIVCLSTFHLSGQDTFEMLISWDNQGDTSITGFVVAEHIDGEFMLLGNVSLFEDLTNGIPIEGPVELGTSIIKISETGEKIWSYLYPTQGIPNRGQIATSHFIIDSNNEIILPYSRYVGLLYCDSLYSNSASDSHKKAVMSIDIETGDIIYNEQYLDDYLCNRDRIIAVKEMNWGYVLLYYENLYNLLNIEKLNHNFEIITSNTFAVQGKTILTSEVNEQILILSNTNISVIDYESNILLNNHSIEVEDTAWTSNIKYAENIDYSVIGMTGSDYNNLNSISTIYVLDNQFNTLQKRLYINESIVDVEITDNNEILVLFDLSRRSWFDTITKPVRITQYDLDLNTVAIGDYGFPYTHCQDISLTNNQQEFLVTGSQLTSIIESESEADQVYFLKARLDDLVVSNELPHQEEVKIEIFPNPTNQNITINYHFDDLQPTIFIYNITGKVVHMQSLLSNESSKLIKLDKSLPSGTYFCHLITNGQVVGVERFVLMH